VAKKRLNWKLRSYQHSYSENNILVLSTDRTNKGIRISERPTIYQESD